MSTNTTYLQLERWDGQRNRFLNHDISYNRTKNPLTTEQKEQQWTQLAKDAEQTVLLLNEPKQQYTLQTEYAILSTSHQKEILVKMVAIGLNPVDWKAPAFNFGIPSLLWINSRDLAGVVVQALVKSPRLRAGDLVLVPSTDYRDIRKAAFQEYAVTTYSNAARIPFTVSVQEAAQLGVAYVASAIALGVCYGLDFSRVAALPGPDLAGMLGEINADEIPEDIRGECFSYLSAKRVGPDELGRYLGSINNDRIHDPLARQVSRPKGSLHRDTARHDTRLLDAGADLLVDRHDPDRAVQTIRDGTDGQLRYAIDIVGREIDNFAEDPPHKFQVPWRRSSPGPYRATQRERGGRAVSHRPNQAFPFFAGGGRVSGNVVGRTACV